LFIIDLSLRTASSVDAECAFSEGRREVGHLQHNMSSQTFEAKMATGSWSKTPLLSLNDINHIIDNRMKRQKGLKKEDKESDLDDSDEGEIEGLE
jgi:hypothetical protein